MLISVSTWLFRRACHSLESSFPVSSFVEKFGQLACTYRSRRWWWVHFWLRAQILAHLNFATQSFRYSSHSHSQYHLRSSPLTSPRHLHDRHFKLLDQSILFNCFDWQCWRHHKMSHLGGWTLTSCAQFLDSRNRRCARICCGSFYKSS